MGGRHTVLSLDTGRSVITSCFGLVLLSSTVFYSQLHSSSKISSSLLRSLVSNSVVCAHERQPQPARPQLQSRKPRDGGFKKSVSPTQGVYFVSDSDIQWRYLSISDISISETSCKHMQIIRQMKWTWVALASCRIPLNDLARDIEVLHFLFQGSWRRKRSYAAKDLISYCSNCSDSSVPLQNLANHLHLSLPWWKSVV